MYQDPATGLRTFDIANNAKWPTASEAKQRKALANRETLGENLRLLYVALTRAEHGTLLWWSRTEGSDMTGLAHVLFAREQGEIDADRFSEYGARLPDDADALGRSETGFSTFMDLLRADLAAAVRDAARGRADPEQMRFIAARPLDAWGEVWQGLTRLQDETEHLNLDTRQALIEGLGLLSGKMR